MSEKKTYLYAKLCKNCGKRTKFEVPFGNFGFDYAIENKILCENCGCNTNEWKKNLKKNSKPKGI